MPAHRTGGLVANRLVPSSASASAVWQLGELEQAVRAGIWPGPWTPPALGSALRLWYDADDASSVTLVGSNVSQWNDKSGNAQNASQATSGNRPAYVTNVLNGRACLRFDGTNDEFTTTHSFNGYTSFSIFAVAKATSDALSQSIVRHQSGGNYMVFPWSGGGVGTPRVILSWDGATTTVNNTGSFTAASIVAFLRSSGSTNIARLNGTQQNSRVANSTAFSVTGNTTICGNVGSECFGGDVHEIIVATGAMSSTDRDKTEGYLAWKWGLTGSLPAGHPYKSSSPTT